MRHPADNHAVLLPIITTVQSKRRAHPASQSLSGSNQARAEAVSKASSLALYDPPPVSSRPGSEDNGQGGAARVFKTTFVRANTDQARRRLASSSKALRLQG